MPRREIKCPECGFRIRDDEDVDVVEASKAHFRAFHEKRYAAWVQQPDAAIRALAKPPRPKKK